MEAFIQQILRVNPTLNAVCHRRFEQAREEAKAADEILKTKNGAAWATVVGVPLRLFPGDELPPFLGSFMSHVLGLAHL